MFNKKKNPPTSGFNRDLIFGALNKYSVIMLDSAANTYKVTYMMGVADKTATLCLCSKSAKSEQNVGSRWQKLDENS